MTSAHAQKTVVVLGSSTAEGFGAGIYADSWVGKYTAYAISLNSSNSVVNLALAGFQTASVMPTGTGGEDPNRNITKALTYNPHAIVVNLPTNDAAVGVPLATTMANFRRLRDVANAAGAVFWVTTSQPRNFNPAGLNVLIQTRDSINAQFGSFAIDFWTTVANTDGTINALYSAGDGIHVNPLAHELFFQRVKAKPILGPTGLPVNFSGLKAAPFAGGLRLEWKLYTGSEKVVQEVQKSTDGNRFSVIGHIAPSSSESFSFTDAQSGIATIFYRIKGTSPTTTKYSEMLRITPNGSGQPVLLYPNPVTDGTVRLQLQRGEEGNVLLLVVNSNGSEVFREQRRVPRGTSSQALQLPSSVARGVYQISVIGNEGFQRKILLVQ